jgi:hypothetical protein
MRSLQLETTLTAFAESAAAHLQNEVLAGAEVPFDLEQGARTGPTGPSLFSYRPLTSAFIRERAGELAALPAFGPARDALASFEGLDGYLAAGGAGQAAPGGPAGAALLALLCDVFEEQSDFQLYADRLERALATLERAAADGAGELTLVATLHGMAIACGELSLVPGLRIAQPELLDDLPAAVREPHAEPHLVVVLSTDEDSDRASTLLHELLRALRLFGDGRVTLGALGWQRRAAGAWLPVALGGGGRPHGMLVVAAGQEEELRVFCSLVARRSPHGERAAWALRRFELGCDRERAGEALSDHLLALRALLEPEGPTSGLLAPRLAALCADGDARESAAATAREAAALELTVIEGGAVDRANALRVTREIAANLRALLRDVVCGHLDSDLVALADEILADEALHTGQAPVAPQAAAAPVAATPAALHEIPRELESVAEELYAEPAEDYYVDYYDEVDMAAPEPGAESAIIARRGRRSAGGLEDVGDPGESPEILDLLG